MSYIRPDKVVSPKASWSLFEVFIDNGPGAAAYAIGTWEGERRVAFRWNGTDTAPLGNPQSRGLPTWTMLDDDIHGAVLALTPPEKQLMVSAFLDIPPPVELVVDWHPSDRRTLKERPVGGHGMYRDLHRDDLFGNHEPTSFYRAALREIVLRQSKGQHVVFVDVEHDEACDRGENVK